jgi:hypothetical protein
MDDKETYAAKTEKPVKKMMGGAVKKMMNGGKVMVMAVLWLAVVASIRGQNNGR